MKVLTSNDPQSFAFDTLAHRIPVILTNVINDLIKLDRPQIRMVIQEISELKSLLSRNKNLTPFEPLIGDEDSWNLLISNHSTFFDSPWLISECYIYRRLISIVYREHKDLDYFEARKKKSCIESFPVMKQRLCMHFTLNELLLNCLWGNQLDCSLLATKELSSTRNVLINQGEKFINSLPVDCISVILDNVGLELFCDLCLCQFLIEEKLSSKVVLHVKPFPWFVSDAMEKDIYYLIQLIKEIDDVRANKWLSFLESGQWNIFTHLFYCSSEPYCHTPSDLLQEFKKSGVLIFKGDLNYRRMTGDVDCEETVEWSENCLGTNCLMIRTLKSNTLVGLPYKVDLQNDWRTNGSNGVIQWIKNK